MTPILLTGVQGQLGRQLHRSLQPLGDVITLDQQQLDLANPDAIRAALRDIKPAVIVNPAAWTAVDLAETESDLAHAINTVAPGVLAEEAHRLDALLVHYSTDYVFDGGKQAPWLESDAAVPLNVYGRSKLAGEQAIAASHCRHLIFRSSWIYGRHGANFLRTMLRLAAERDQLRIVGDQIGAPTWSRTLADATALALARYAGQNGVHHVAANDHTSWCGFAAAIIEGARRRGMLTQQPDIQPITSAEYPTPAPRPLNSRLDCSKLAADFNLHLPSWRRQLDLCLDDMCDETTQKTPAAP